jgi:hypothetical protein
MDNKKNPTAILMAGYNIEQVSVGELSETCNSTINVKFIVHDTDTGPDKHSQFLNELKEFLKERNNRLRQP